MVSEVPQSGLPWPPPLAEAVPVLVLVRVRVSPPVPPTRAAPAPSVVGVVRDVATGGGSVKRRARG